MIILIAEKFCQSFFSDFQPKPPGLYGEPTSASAASFSGHLFPVVRTIMTPFAPAMFFVIQMEIQF